MAKRILQYLEELSELDLRLEAVDATSYDDMNALIRSVDTSIGGCVLLSGLSSDRVFAHLSEDDFSKVFAPKIVGMEVLESVCNIPELDFLVALTSASGTYGIGGQTNYAA